MTTTLPPKLGRYEVLEEIGKGAMGVVYLARDPLIGRLVALKTFRVGFTAKDEELVQFRSRFVREAQSAGILSHPNIVTIHDVVDEGGSGTCFIAMEYVKGTNLKHLLQRTEPFAHAFVVDVVSQIAEALDYAHSRGVIHRDIKPANILITADNRVKITDFGIARMDTSNLTMEGQLLGTPNYMAPEQIQGKDVDHRADIFSLGVVFYELVTRRKPFQGENLTQVTHKIVYEPFTPPEDVVEGLPAGLSAVLNRCLQKDPNRRYPRATEVAKELRAVLEQQESLEDTVGTMEVEAHEPALDQAPTRQLDRAAVLEGAAAAPPLPPVDASPTRKLDRAEALGPAPAAAPVQSAAAKPSAAPALAPPPKPPPTAPVAPMTPKPAPPPPAAQARGASAEPRAGAPRRKGLWLALAGLAAAVVVVAIGVWALGGEEPAPARPLAVAPSPSPEQQTRIMAATALSEARTRFTSGDLDGALAAIARAELAEPDNLEIKALRATIESGQRQQAAEAERERQISEGLATAGAAMGREAWEEAIVAARGVLAVDPEREAARTILADAQRAQRRAREEADAAVRASAAAAAVPPPQPAAVSEAPASPVASATDAPLKIEFSSDLSEGVLTIYAGERQIVREPFRFVRKSGLFSREKVSGTLEAQRRIPVGPLMLRVYVAIPGSPTKAIALEKEVRGGVSYRLVVRVDAEGRTSAELR